jgi:hypothetical protein
MYCIVANVMRSLRTLFLDIEDGDAVNLVVFLNGEFIESHSNQSRTGRMNGFGLK